MTQKIKFQWYFDFSTSAESMQIITVSAGGQDVVDRLRPFFGAYKYYKLGSVKCSLVPASTLPVDPTGLSYEAGETTVDPRDQLNCGLTRITNGEDFLDDLTGFSDAQIEAIYEAMMVDPRWYKWSLQSGLKRSAYPKYWTVGQLHQDYFPGATINKPLLGASAGAGLQSTETEYLYDYNVSAEGNANTNPRYVVPSFSDPRGLFQTGHKGRLGWMPTDALIHYANSAGVHDKTSVAPIPSIELFKIITPKAHKTVYYYRCYVTEEVYFKMPITSQTLYNTIGVGGLMMLDRFTYANLSNAQFPKETAFGVTPLVQPNDGSGEEDNHGSD